MKIIKDNLGKVAITCNGYWDKALSYDRLCIVITSLKADNISTFISRKPVPVGIDITNEEYWMRLGNSINFKTINGHSILGEGDILIDTSLYRIVNELPTNNIEEKIYVLVSYGSEIDNDHTEWVYIDNQWEKLGDSTFVRFEDLGIEVTDELSRNELKSFVTNGRSVGTINTINVTKGENGSINISGKKSSRGGGYHDYYNLRDYSIEIPVVSDTNNGLVPKLPSNFGYYFPISRVNPNSADNSTDWYSFEEPSVYNRDDEGPLNTVNIELSVCKAGSDIPNVLWDISIPAVSNNGAGVMTPQSYNDLVSIKAKTDALPTYVMNGNTINYIADSNGVTLQFPISRLVNDSSNPIPYNTITIPIATTSQAGVMSPNDKQKLANIIMADYSHDGLLSKADYTSLHKLIYNEPFIIRLSDYGQLDVAGNTIYNTDLLPTIGGTKILTNNEIESLGVDFIHLGSVTNNPNINNSDINPIPIINVYNN